MQRIAKYLKTSGLLMMASLTAGVLVTVPVSGQTPTPDQMEVFRSLPADQQRQILGEIGQRRGEPQPAAPMPAATVSQPKTEDVSEVLVESLEKTPRLRAGESLLLTVDLIADDGAATAGAARSKSEPAADAASTQYQLRLLSGNPYKLDRMGRVVLFGVDPIVLAGLSASEAARRLNAEPQLQGFTFGVQLLPVEPELRPFGYDLFSSVPTTFAPATDIPVPSEYVVGPGDVLTVQLIGERGGNYTLPVNRDGMVDFPQLGPISVAGQRFTAVKAMLERSVSEQMIGMRASVSMGPLRSIQVFVLGEAERPGSYTVSGLSTITNALFASGGVKPIGSLRNIQLKRNGQLVRRLDLYDLLLAGDTSNDVRLLPGDVIFIPPVGPTVAASGEVQRPAIYEVFEGTSAADVLYLAGGLTPEADPRTATLERIDARRNRTVLDLDLTTAQARGTRLQTGDMLRIQAIRASFEGAVALEGHVFRTGGVQYRPGMRLTDLVGSLDELKPLADLHYVLIRRETGPDRRVSVLSADLEAAFKSPRSDANPQLQARDRIYVFDLANSRDRIIAPIISDLNRQSGSGLPVQTVGIGGRVKVPGQYPLEPGMTVSDLLRAGGGLDQAAYGASAELTRYEVVNGERRQTALMNLDLAQLLAGDSAADVALQSFDFVVIKEMPQWRDQESVIISGQVRFPGTYPIRNGETLKSVLARAGGVTSLAFPEGAVFTRAELRDRERQQLGVMADRLQQDLATLALQSSQASSQAADQASETLALGQTLLRDLRNAEPVGRLVINLTQVLASDQGSPNDVILKDGDRLIVPEVSQVVMVLGEVQSPVSHFYNPSLSRDDYINLSGGTTRRADGRRTYVVRANGSVVAGNGNAWFRSSDAIRPGDTIVVPLDAERMRPLPLWTSVSTIIFNLAVAVAAIGSI